MNEFPRLPLVDDDFGVRASLSAFLTCAGFLVETVSDGVQALSTLENRSPT